MNVNSIILNNVEKDFFEGKNKIKILNKINLEFKQGNSYGIFGSSGSGKTTLAQIIGLLDVPTKGDVIFNNLKTNRLNIKDRLKIIRKNLGFVYQFHYLLEHFSVFENIFIQAQIAGFEQDIANALTKNILYKTGLTKRENHYPSMLSGGEKQRVAIARALVKKPKILIVDEPTGSLDLKLGNEIFDLMLKTSKELDVIFIMVTHNENFLPIFDKTFKMEEINK